MDVSIDNEQRNKHLRNYIADFGNIFKAFIGANFLAIPYAFKQSGLLTGAIGLFVIAILTDHCCKLLVTCKTYIVEKITKEYQDVTEEADIDDEMAKLTEKIQTNMNYTDIGRICLGKAGVFAVDISLLMTQFSFCVAYFVLIGNTLYRLVNPTIIKRLVNPTYNKTVSTNFTDVTNHTENLTETFRMISSNVSFIPYGMSVKGKTAPPIEVLILAPLPILLLLSLIRHIRQLGFTSSIANISLLIGFVTVTAYVSYGFSVAKSVKYFINTHSFPVIFGQMTSAYEGIGLIVPIYSSMTGNRGHFKFMLTSSISLLTLIFLLFGTLGYLRYGEQTLQSINLNIETEHGALELVINIALICGVLFTFSLQMMPVYDLVEPWIFHNTSREDVHKPESQHLLQNQTVNSTDEMPLPISPGVPSEVSLWKRNTVRFGLVILAAIFAVICKDIFAYVIAISGAIGSTILAFILPGLCDLHLRGHELPTHHFIKDVIIVGVGLVGGSTSLVYSIQEIVDTLRNRN